MTSHTRENPPSHQTVRLSRGRHRSPEDGVCVMELASMLAGERFSDRPRSVCPVVATFLRRYNDLVDDSRRQDLYVYAAMAVGTAGEEERRRGRAQLCARLGEAYGASPSRCRRLMTRWRAEGHALSAAEVLADDASRHGAALLLLDLMLEEGDRRSEGGATTGGAPARQTASEATLGC